MLFPWFMRRGIPCPFPTASPISPPSALLQPSHSDSALQQLCHMLFFTETSTPAVSSFSTHGQPLISFKPLLNCLFFQKACPEYPGETATHPPPPHCTLDPPDSVLLVQFFQSSCHQTISTTNSLTIGLAKRFILVFPYTLWKNSNDLIGQPNTNTVSQSSASLDAPRPHGSVCVLVTCLEQCLNE